MGFPLSSNSLARQIKVRSAVNPSLWACAVISVPLFYYAKNSDGLIAIGFFLVGCIPVSLLAISYTYLVFKNPAYLRSEEFQLKMETLKYFGDKDNPLHAEAYDAVELINNPKLPPPNTQGEISQNHE